MKNIRLFIDDNYLKVVQALSDESYLYNYIVNNYTELPEDNIFRSATCIKNLENVLFLSKNNISEDDILVWNETSVELNKKKIPYYAVIIDTKNESFFVYNKLERKIPYLDIDKNTDMFDAVNKIEKFNRNLEYEDEMEM